MSKPFVAILMGSDSDLPQVEPALDTLSKLKIPYEVKVTSAHRTPEITHSYVKDADKRGCSVFICAAGMAAHLAGAVAAATTKPVIGIPINASMNGLDSLLSTVQMPGGIPVATVAIGKAGAKNAAYLAAQMMSLADSELAQRVKDDRAANAKAVQEKDAALQARLAQKD
ncbi:5-(carboxyamino)imidazole ribonucleotide mutase [Ketobacter alkanivorans]|uniref:N5-carboxyaminoimidazole ribonucleotide mutase n=1 Tax=Ketobacter alkanivorans TaxID=1917421 RepID=A0A2K9LKY6_9GAMM|nr:5-(carboxyamino)imidazole ribonucleotide mutase [Ketobacter alkanivorans]AUM12988.1 5-(carboxyamino)imidazole ribonucleotide mutase [Ketobacter alkanivorans]MCP5016036.1 5-(carboxyamino)imidazole ribonucleotide mutase [Ketobacter sp.]